jgi:hypothetical protein
VVTNTEEDSAMRCFIWALVLMAGWSGLAFGEERPWGTLRGRFVYDGEPPGPGRLPVSKDKDVFGASVLDESLLVNRDNRGIANVVIYLMPNSDLHVHPSYDATANAKVDLEFVEGRFRPHIVLLRTSQILVQHNRDPVLHNANIAFFQNSPM